MSKRACPTCLRTNCGNHAACLRRYEEEMARRFRFEQAWRHAWESIDLYERLRRRAIERLGVGEDVALELIRRVHKRGEFWLEAQYVDALTKIDPRMA